MNIHYSLVKASILELDFFPRLVIQQLHKYVILFLVPIQRQRFDIIFCSHFSATQPSAQLLEHSHPKPQLHLSFWVTPHLSDLFSSPPTPSTCLPQIGRNPLSGHTSSLITICCNRDSRVGNLCILLIYQAPIFIVGQKDLGFRQKQKNY